MVKAIPAATYIRMSSDGQEASPDQQRKEVARYAEANGYEIVQWFEDLGSPVTRPTSESDFSK